LADRVAVLGWQVPATLALLTVAVLALGRRTDFGPYRDAAALIGGAAVVVATPAALGLPWWTPMVLSGAAALALALTAARLRGDREVLFTAAVAAALGGHAAVVSLAGAGSTAIVLGATVAGCLLVAATARTPRLRDAAVGGALAALPGAAAATAAVLSARPALVLSLGLATASLALGVASILGLARRAEAPAAGAVAGALACVAVVLVVPSATGWDYLTASLLLIGALARLSRRHRESRGAGGATLALIAEMSQLVALLVPGAPLVTTAVVVALVAFAVWRLPAQWRPGPTAGLALACAVLALTAGAATLVDAVAVPGTLAPGADLAAWQAFEPAGAQLLDWQPAVALLILAATAAGFSRRRPGAAGPDGWGDPARASAFAVTVAALAAVHAPVGFGLPWWAPSTVAGLAALGLGLLATRLPVRWTGLLAAALAAGSGAYAGATALARPASTATVLCGLIAAGSVVAAVAVRAAGPAARATGTGAVAAATALMPATAVAVARALELAGSTPHVALFGAVLALGAGLVARRWYPHAALAGVALAVATTLVLPPFGPTPVHIALAALIGVAAGLGLPPRTAAGHRPVLGGLIAAVLPVAVLAGITAPAVLLVLVAPYGWLARPWSAQPADSWLGLMPGSADWTEPGPVLIAPALALTTLTVGLLVRFTTARRWLVPAVLPGAAATVLVTPATTELAWPAGVAAAALVAVTAGVGASLVGRGAPVPGRLAIAMSGALAVGAGGAALAGATATRATTYAALGIAVLAGAAAGWFGRRPGARTAGWMVASVAGLGCATVAAGDWDAIPLALGPFVAAVVLLGAAAVPESRDRRPGEVVPIEVVAHVAAAGALATATTLRQAALVLVGYGAALGLSALRPRRRGYAIVAGAAELLAWWMLLFAAEVGVIEAYTLPFALVALVGGVVGLRTRPALRSWVAYGPALAAAFLPSLALVLATPGEPLRRLLVGTGAIAVVVVGGARRRQAPVLVGALVLVLVTLHELVVWWDLLPRWIPLAVGGLLLVSVGATYERRRRDLRALRTAVGGMR
jgi:hypothetical protein